MLTTMMYILQGQQLRIRWRRNGYDLGEEVKDIADGLVEVIDPSLRDAVTVDFEKDAASDFSGNDCPEDMYGLEGEDVGDRDSGGDCAPAAAAVASSGAAPSLAKFMPSFAMAAAMSSSACATATPQPWFRIDRHGHILKSGDECGFIRGIAGNSQRRDCKLRLPTT